MLAFSNGPISGIKLLTTASRELSKPPELIFEAIKALGYWNYSGSTTKSLNIGFIDAYDFHLRVDKQMNGNTVLNHTIPLRKMVRSAISQDIIKRDPFVNYVAEKPLKQRRHLTMDEFQKLLTTPITEKHLERCRDMFLFACFSGMAFSDVKDLSPEHLVKDNKGELWIRIERQKTKSECRIRLLSVPIQIMEKYKHERTDDKIFKLKTLKTIDENLKNIAQKCGIESRLCYHMGRHTYATTVCIQITPLINSVLL